MKKLLLSILFAAALSQASVEELLPRLTDKNLDVQTQARLDLLAYCSKASSPDASEADRKKAAEEICAALGKNLPEEVMSNLIWNLERIGGAEAVPVLTKLLGSSSGVLRDDARRALAVNPAEEAGQALGMQLKNRRAKSPAETAGLIYALGERKQAGASKLIAPYLNQKDPQVFTAAVRALSMIGEPEGIRALAEKRAASKGWANVLLTDALFAMDHQAVFEKLYAESEPMDVRSVALLGLIMGGNLDVAKTAMDSGEPELQAAVIEAALQTKSPKLGDLIAPKLGTLFSAMKLRAVIALGAVGEESYAETVAAMLKENDETLQDAASQALVQIGSPSVAEALLLNGRPESSRALGQIEGIDQALEKVAVDSTDDNLRSAAIDALANRGRADLMPKFMSWAQTDGRATSASAARAMGQVGEIADLDEVTQLMIKMEAAPVSRDLLLAVVDIIRRSAEQEKAVSVLVGNMNGASPRSQSNILQALVQTESEAALAPLAEACRSKDEQLQKTAVKLLGGWKNENGLESMIKLASDESLSTANNVVLIRGVSRILAGQDKWKFKADVANKALEACRREDERKMIQDVMDKNN